MNQTSFKLPNKKSSDEERYQAFIKNSSEGIWRFEVDVPIPTTLPPGEQIKLMYKYAYLAEANDAMAKVYGLKSGDDIVGTRLSKMLVKSDLKNTEYLTAFIKSGYKISGMDSHEKDIDGNDKYFRNSLVGIVKNNVLVRAWGTQQDVTEQIQTFKKLKKSEARLALALKASRMGIWEWNLETNELLWSPELKTLFGIAPEEKMTFDKYIGHLHPEDRRRTKKIIKDARKTNKEFNFEHRAVWPDGTVRWLLCHGKIVFRDGKPISMIGSAVDIEDLVRRKELEKKASLLSQQRTELLEINRAKDDFISLASHQLRTPATSVKQYIGMLLDGYGGKLNQKQLSMLRTAFESNERQLSIIEDLLKVARLDAGKVILKPRRTNITKMMFAIIRDSKSIFDARNQQIIYRPTEGIIYARVDSSRLRMAIENLLENANKYTPKGKSVEVYLRQNKTSIVIKISDMGIGIAKDNLKHLFQKFSRIETPRSIAVSGNGLGLYWVKKIVDLHGGSVSAESTPHKGSTFTIKIPLH